MPSANLHFSSAPQITVPPDRTLWVWMEGKAFGHIDSIIMESYLDRTLMEMLLYVAERQVRDNISKVPFTVYALTVQIFSIR